MRASAWLLIACGSIVSGACSGTTSTPEMSAVADLATAPDLASAPDLTIPVDAPAPDLIFDFQVPDLRPAADLMTTQLPNDCTATTGATLVTILGSVQIDSSETATVTLMTATPPVVVTTHGNFQFNVPENCHAIMKAEAPGHTTVLRGVLAKANLRPREFWTDPSSQLDPRQDMTKGVIEADYRNSVHGGYDVQIVDSSGSVTTPGYCIVSDDMGNAIANSTSCDTVAGGNGSTLWLGNVSSGVKTLSATASGDLGPPCMPCDLTTLPVIADTITMVEYECGSANCM